MKIRIVLFTCLLVFIHQNGCSAESLLDIVDQLDIEEKEPVKRQALPPPFDNRIYYPEHYAEEKSSSLFGPVTRNDVYYGYPENSNFIVSTFRRISRIIKTILQIPIFFIKVVMLPIKIVIAIAKIIFKMIYIPISIGYNIVTTILLPITLTTKYILGYPVYPPEYDYVY